MRYAAVLFLVCLAAPAVLADFDEEKARQNVIKWLGDIGLEDELGAGVNVETDESGLLSIVDEGHYLLQYGLLTPARSADAEVTISDELKIKPTAKNFVIVVHGWFDKGEGDWPEDMAGAFYERTDPNSWVCGYFDWQGGAAVATPMDAARYSCDVAGPRLAKALLSLPNEIEHVHLIGHSAGSWAIDTAAERIARKTGATIHLTFLDAYVPPKWDKSLLGHVSSARDGRVYVEHYYTRDITYECTHEDLARACNVDITDIDFGIKEHEFPYRWYRATAAGEYLKSEMEYGQAVVFNQDGVAYGFARGLEAGKKSWKQSLKLVDRETVMIRKPKRKSKWKLF
ncbi:hypothetical protein STSP2_01322 [Anaerohalosphaera lusitana]|uniref:Lipase domain-containing protein n=1 Tax=Anaerohalosphaera lusitana TaxID=1936003 RepID=A0A1U9NK28_9BACT|nr:alpha/beta hydrolase [Anaerohalosphaera lusitana]AQT68167.1 hypothetical protein STSP2_01322 [Anaerohalosphaera lusitana]